ncbi:MAG: M15 family metallopeptidase [Mycobacteriales bacterium]
MRPPSLRLLALVLLVSSCRAGNDAAVQVATPSPVVTATPSPTASPTPSAAPTSIVTRAPVTASPTPRRTPATTYRWSARRVTAADLPHSWRSGCPVGPAQLRLLTLPYIGFDGARHTGRLVVNASATSEVARAFGILYAKRFPIRSLRPIDDFGGSDDDSMAADNTSGFNCRQAVGGSGWSMHAYGLAIDIDPRENPYLEGGKVRPPQGRPYVDRSHVRPGMVVAGGVAVRAFAAIGWSWGGRWRSSPDYQHFSSNGK